MYGLNNYNSTKNKESVKKKNVHNTCTNTPLTASGLKKKTN